MAEIWSSVSATPSPIWIESNSPVIDFVENKLPPSDPKFKPVPSEVEGKNLWPKGTLPTISGLPLTNSLTFKVDDSSFILIAKWVQVAIILALIELLNLEILDPLLSLYVSLAAKALADAPLNSSANSDPEFLLPNTP